MQIAEKSPVLRVHWIGVKHIKEAPFYIPTSLDDWVDRSFGRWLTKLVVISIAGERFKPRSCDLSSDAGQYFLQLKQ
jgi:hypothetical protein